MRHTRGRARLGALVLALLIVAAACGGGDDRDDGRSDAAPTTAGGTGEVPSGGTLVIGAEQEGDCTDWIGTCGGSSWFFWSIAVHTIPRAFSVERTGDGWAYRTTSVLAGEPTLETEPNQVVTYRIDPDAQWSDGTPITSRDFAFTWEQIARGDDIYDRTGYDRIESVDASAPGTAIVTFREPYADWKSLFGGSFGLLPAHLVNDHHEMADGYAWSGGPWRLDHWTKGVEWVLVPNENYWGEKPKLDRVVFRPIADTSAEFQAFTAGEVHAIYPQPQLDAVDQIAAGLPDANAQYSGETGNAEALWMNNARPPFDDVAFRRAVAHAVDRDAIVKRLFGKVGVDRALQTVTAPILSRFASTDAFADYERDLDRVDEVMRGAGWRKGADGIWAKGGSRATFAIRSTAGNKRRELTEQVLQQQLREAGFEMTIENAAAGDLIGSMLPQGDFQVGLYANVLTSFYPSNCNLFCSKNIPTEANGFSGNNWTRTSDPELDRLLSALETELDEDAAASLNRRADERLADIVAVLPLDPLPNILLTSTDVVGPVDDNPVMGPFWKLAGWGLAT